MYRKNALVHMSLGLKFLSITEALQDCSELLILYGSGGPFFRINILKWCFFGEMTLADKASFSE